LGGSVKVGDAELPLEVDPHRRVAIDSKIVGQMVGRVEVSIELKGVPELSGRVDAWRRNHGKQGSWEPIGASDFASFCHSDDIKPLAH